MTNLVSTPAALEEAVKEAQVVSGKFFGRFRKADSTIQIGWDGIGFIAKMAESADPVLLDDVAAGGLLPLVPMHCT